MITSQQEYHSRRFIMNLLLFLSGKNIYHNLSQVSQVLQQTIGGGCGRKCENRRCDCTVNSLDYIRMRGVGQRASERVYTCAAYVVPEPGLTIPLGVQIMGQSCKKFHNSRMFGQHAEPATYTLQSQQFNMMMTQNLESHGRGDNVLELQKFHNLYVWSALSQQFTPAESVV